ncbi:sigma-70 family RNA polymerase sigma factor [Actinomycetospora lemnae]|uniref:Sigma-70 family RNA polymerase sigma factor n=1 Tax=Actinomycetospora lemnae TaxID=3019891 RepID=A0ABT5T215_9PSEU|nr:sigma-70 family RNA polymerase sigma factor [Actinomycetospora sp. DW7H6]MDD7969146.1 sigma-70 family RNA polymerase sigma factor [Actinomycetospora sp. DW7H6]
MDTENLATTFETHRPHLRAVTMRLLGSPVEADDAVQETWLRLARTDVSEVENLRAWLTTVAGRVALTMLQRRGTRAESDLAEAEAAVDEEPDPETRALQADALGAALHVVLERLEPAERLAFVLHDLFAVPFDEIATVVERSPAAARQLASRARRRVRGGSADGDPDPARRREVVAAFLTAARDGDFAGLLGVLDPDVELRADRVALAAAAANPNAPQVGGEMRGAEVVARVFTGRATAAQPALLDGAFGVAYAPGGQVRAAFDLVIVGGRIVAIEMIADPDVLAGIEVELR